jgi:hypothetical protein
MKKPTTLALTAALLAACAGYSPLYTPINGENLAQKVQVGDVFMTRLAEKNVGERRVAQVINQHLRQDFAQTGAEMDTLTVGIREDSSPLALRRTALVEREQLTLTGNITITNPAGDKLFNTEVGASTAYNVQTTPYGTESGKTYARLTAARNLAEEITRRVALFYRTQGQSAATSE